MNNLENVKKAYENLYRKLKAEAVEATERNSIPPNVRQEIIEYVSNLPHPRVASIWDIRDVCMTCISGPLEYLYGLFGNDARIILDKIRKEEFIEIYPPPKPGRYSVDEIGAMLAWTNEAQLRQMSLLQAVKVTSDITLKGRCPNCASDLMIVIIKDSELHLRCRNRLCKKEWFIQDVTASP